MRVTRGNVRTGIDETRGRWFRGHEKEEGEEEPSRIKGTMMGGTAEEFACSS